MVNLHSSQLDIEVALQSEITPLQNAAGWFETAPMTTAVVWLQRRTEH